MCLRFSGVVAPRNGRRTLTHDRTLQYICEQPATNDAPEMLRALTPHNKWRQTECGSLLNTRGEVATTHERACLPRKCMATTRETCDNAWLPYKRDISATSHVDVPELFMASKHVCNNIFLMPSQMGLRKTLPFPVGFVSLTQSLTPLLRVRMLSAPEVLVELPLPQPHIASLAIDLIACGSCEGREDICRDHLRATCENAWLPPRATTSDNDGLPPRRATRRQLLEPTMLCT